MKAVIRQTGTNEVTLQQDSPWGGPRETIKYYVPHGGGYVRQRSRSGNDPQVCEMLANSGSTLEAKPDTLLALIRAENKRAVAYERKIEQRQW